MTVKTFRGEDAWIEAALAELLAAALSARAEGRDSLALVLAGGSTPEGPYRAMAAQGLAGLRVDLWLGDERVVPAADPARNLIMVERAFADCSWDFPPRLRAWPEAETEAQAISASALYEEELAASLGSAPAFDLALLGLGADGHTASVFPSRAGSEDEGAGRLVAVTRSPLPPPLRMTLTLGALRGARRRVFLVRGSDKLPALARLEAEDPAIPASALAGPGAIALYLR